MNTYTVAGRKFVHIGRDRTLSHDAFIHRLVGECGLRNLQPRQGETEDAFSARVYYEAADKPAFMDLLGALYLPEGTAPVAWRSEVARANTAFFATVLSPEDRVALMNMAVRGLSNFFPSGPKSTETSPPSGRSRQEGRPRNQSRKASRSLNRGTKRSES